MKKFLRFILIIIIAICSVVVYRGYKKYDNAITELPLKEAVNIIQSKDDYTVYSDIPEIYFKAVVAVEDRRYYTHKGFDIIGTSRALINAVKNREFTEGGSTITQQLAKNMYFELDNTLDRKIAEIFMALKIESSYQKDEILELYVNGIYYGSGYYSIYSASRGYFDKKPSKMTNDECTLLAGIPNAPSVYSLNVNPDLAKQRQEKVISTMIECGYIENEDEIFE